MISSFMFLWLSVYVNVCVSASVCVYCAFSLDFTFPVHLFVLSCSGFLIFIIFISFYSFS